MYLYSYTYVYSLSYYILLIYTNEMWYTYKKKGKKMKKYKLLLFDLDDTLINNDLALNYAFQKLTERIGVPYSRELFDAYQKHDEEYWKKFSNDEILIPASIKTIDDKVAYVRGDRFATFFKTIELPMEEWIEANAYFASQQAVCIEEIPGAKQTLEDLYNKNYQIVIATNGPTVPAIKKVNNAGFKPYVSKIITSGDIGFSKPSAEFFNYLFEKCDTFDKESMLLIGDSLKTDVLGGMLNGIDTCWFNTKNEKLPDEYQPTYIIYTIKELTEILK